MALPTSDRERNSRRTQEHPRASGWLLWLRKGSLAFADQAFVAGSNFIVSVLLARWLFSEQYGAYALAFSVFLLLSLGHQALLLEPMAVLGPSRHRDRLREYMGELLRIHLTVALPIMGVLGLSAFIAWKLVLPGDLGGAFAGLTLAAPCILLLWLARRSLYLRLAPGWAAIGALVYCTLLLGGLAAVYAFGRVSVFSAFLLMALAALAVSGLLLFRVRPIWGARREADQTEGVWRQHWDYGRWALPAYLFHWMPENVLYLLTAAFLTFGEVGALKAVLNLLLPVSHSSVALSLLFLPYVSGVFGERGKGHIRVPVRRIILLFVAGAIVYGVIVSFMREPVFHLLYGGKFVEFAHLIPWVCVVGVLGVAAQASFLGLRAMQSPSSVFAASCSAGLLAIAVGVFAIPAYGLPGAVGAYLVAAFTRLVVAQALWRRKTRRSLPIGGVACSEATIVGD